MSFDKSFEHKQKLLDAALEEFTAYGYEQASINRILERAGMSKGQFYYHFNNKETLYLSLTAVLVERKLAFLSSAMQPIDLQQDIFGIFEAQIRYGLAFAAHYPAIYDFGQSFLREKGNDIYDKALAANRFENQDSFNQLIEMAYQKGEFRDDLPLPFIKRTISYLFNHVTDFVDLTKPAEWESNLNYLINFMRHGLAKSQESGVQKVENDDE